MQQATQPTMPTAPVEAREPDPQRLAFQHAHMVTGDIVNRLAVQPFAVETEQDFPSGWRSHLKFRSDNAAGLLDFARMVKAPVTTAVTQFGVHVECLARLDKVELRASALLSHEEASALSAQVPAARLRDQEDDNQPASSGRSGGQAGTDPYALSMDRYAASLGGSVVAQVPAVQTDPDPSTISLSAVTPDTTGGEQ